MRWDGCVVALVDNFRMSNDDRGVLSFGVYVAHSLGIMYLWRFAQRYCLGVGKNQIGRVMYIVLIIVKQDSPIVIDHHNCLICRV